MEPASFLECSSDFTKEKYTRESGLLTPNQICVYILTGIIALLVVVVNSALITKRLQKYRSYLDKIARRNIKPKTTVDGSEMGEPCVLHGLLYPG